MYHVIADEIDHFLTNHVHEDNHSTIEIMEMNPNFQLVVDRSHVPYQQQIMTKIFLHVQLINHNIVEMLLDNVRNLVVIIQYIIQLDELNHRFSFVENHHFDRELLNIQN